MALTLTTIGCNKSAKQTSGIDLANLDTTAIPKNDFYQFACGGWMKNNPLTAEYSRFGSFDQLGENNRKQLNELIQEIAGKTHETGSIEQKIGDLYNLSLDTVRRNNEGIAPALPYIKEVQSLSDKKDIPAFLGSSLDAAIFGVYVDADDMNSTMNVLKMCQGGFALGNRDYYMENDEHTQFIRAEYIKSIEEMFTAFGIDNAQERAKTVLRMETRLAAAAKTRTELRDPIANYNKMSMAELKELAPEINWDAFFKAARIKTDTVIVGQPNHLKEASKFLAEESLDDLKTLFTWQVINGAKGSLSDDIYMIAFHFAGTIMSGREEPSPRWKRAVGIVNGVLGEAVGQMYVAKYFPPEAKERMTQLVNNLQVALGERIAAQEWMSETTKTKAQEKLNAFTVKIGYPDKWRDYSALTIDPKKSYYENLRAAQRFDEDYALSELNKPVDRAKWFMTPQTVNAYYNPATNEICFPAGILQYPFFDMQADDAFNYGAIGVVIGHEMTHGFDDQGSLYDKEGNLNDWWTAEDRENFKIRTKVMADFFSGIEVADSVFANGELTLGENIADHGGLNVAFQAYKNATKCAPVADKDGFTADQRFFLAYANVWANNIRPEEILQRTKSDPHSLGMWRVNGALPHIDAWYDVWNVTPESPLYIAPEKRVRVW